MVLKIQSFRKKKLTQDEIAKLCIAVSTYCKNVSTPQLRQYFPLFVKHQKAFVYDPQLYLYFVRLSTLWLLVYKEC